MVSKSQRFTSKRDWWLVLLLAGTAGLSLYSITILLTAPEPIVSKVLFTALLAAAMAFVIWTLSTTYYEVTDTVLYVRSGPFRYHFPVREIRSVTPSRSPLSSPALSLDRLLIRLDARGREILVSPKDKDGFRNALLQRCPQLRRDGDRLVSRTDDR